MLVELSRLSPVTDSPPNPVFYFPSSSTGLGPIIVAPFFTSAVLPSNSFLMAAGCSCLWRFMASALGTPSFYLNPPNDLRY